MKKVYLFLILTLTFTGCIYNPVMPQQQAKSYANEIEDLLFKVKVNKDLIDDNLPKLEKAKAFIIFPKITKYSFAYGYESGDGIMYKIINNKLSKPIFVSLKSGSLGYCIGYSTRTDLVLIYTDEYLNDILDDGITETDFTSHIANGTSGKSVGDDGKEYEIISRNTGGLIFAADFKTYSVSPNEELNKLFNEERQMSYARYHKISNTVAKKENQFLTNLNSKVAKVNNIQKKEFNIADLDYKFKESKNKNFDSFALIIGINDYKENTEVEYADNSALVFKELAMKTMGIPKENIITLLNSDATSGQIKAKIELIKELADKNGNIYLYFAGHGVPGIDGNTYLLPNDMSADSIHLESNLKLSTIYSKLKNSEAKNAFVFVDSCFSGKDDGGKLLYKGVAPVLKVKKNTVSSSKLTVLTAGASKDFANDFEEKEQRLFSYYLIKELATGKKDLNSIYKTIRNKVKRKSLLKGIGYKQIPQIYGNKSISIY